MRWDGSGHGGLYGRCRPSCCATPYGHSPVRDGLSEWRRCKCHDVPEQPERDADAAMRRAIFGDGDDAA